MLGWMPVTGRRRLFHRALEECGDADGHGNGDEEALHSAQRSGAVAEWRDRVAVRMLVAPGPTGPWVT